MADEKKITPFWTTEKVTVYAPKGAKYHTHGQAVEIQARQKDKFLKLGYTATEEESKDAEAHPAIALPQPKAKATKASVAAAAGEDPNKPAA